MSPQGWIGLSISLTVLLVAFGLGAWYSRKQPQRLVEPPKPSEVTDIIAPLPLLFGRPIRHRYDPEEFETSLDCVTCHQAILPQAEFWEIPILKASSILHVDRPQDAMLAVCLQCDSRSPYDKLES